MKNEIFDRLRDFVIRQSCVDDEVITNETRLEDDLGVSGADGVDFIVAYGKEFNVDVSAFKAADYFSPEGGGGILQAIIKSLTNEENNANRKVLTVGHLLKGVQSGRLDEEVIMNDN